MPVRRGLLIAALLVMTLAAAAPAATLTEDAIRDHIYGGWLGQAAGVTLGGPWEFRVPWPAPDIRYYDPLPTECPDQDDLYIELVSLLALEAKGPDFTAKDIGALWPEYLRPEIIWAANRAAFENIRAGILPPDSGHPKWNASWDAIDAQIEADLFGLVAPGMVDVGARAGYEASRVTNWGAGSYGAVFVAGCYSAAFVETDIESVVTRALRTISPKSEYATMVRLMLSWKHSGIDWQTARERLAWLYEPRHDAISAMINSGAVIIALLWGEGDFSRTIQIGTMCGWDSDCNPSTAGGIVGCMIGASRIPEEWTKPLNDTYRNTWALPKLERDFLTFTELSDRTWAVAQRFLRAHGAKRATGANGVVSWRIPEGSKWMAPLEEVTPAQAATWRSERFQALVARFAPGWIASDVGPDMAPGLLAGYLGRTDVLMLHPLNRETSAKLTRSVRRVGERAVLTLTVSSFDGAGDGYAAADWVLRVRVGDRVVFEQTIDRENGVPIWRTLEVDLTDALPKGEERTVTIENAPDDWAWEAGYFGELKLSGAK